MYERINLEDLEARDVDGVEPELLAVGYELRPEKMRPSAWVFEPGESNNRHRQREQEELYLVLDGRFAVEVDGEAFEVEEGEVVIVPPESWRQFTALEVGTLFVVGAPNVKDDAIQDADEDAQDADEDDQGADEDAQEDDVDAQEDDVDDTDDADR